MIRDDEGKNERNLEYGKRKNTKKLKIMSESSVKKKTEEDPHPIKMYEKEKK